MAFQKEKQLSVQENIEVKPNFTSQEFFYGISHLFLDKKYLINMSQMGTR